MIVPRDQFVRLLNAACDGADWLPWHEPTHPEYEGDASDAGRELHDAIEAVSHWVAKSWRMPDISDCHGTSAGRMVLAFEEGLPI